MSTLGLGHPNKERFIHMLKPAHASEEIVEHAKKFQCSVCSATRLKSSHAVAKHKRAEVFNQELYMDTFDLPIYQQKVLKMLNIIDEGTGMQICVPLWKGAKAKLVRKAYRKHWKRWAGTPIKVVTDGGKEFDGVMRNGLEEDGTYVEKTAAYAPWQNGACERHGGYWKQTFAKAFSESQPRNRKEVDELVDHVNNARNMMARKHGYSPMQHVFGCELQMTCGTISSGGRDNQITGHAASGTQGDGRDGR